MIAKTSAVILNRNDWLCRYKLGSEEKISGPEISTSARPPSVQGAVPFTRSAGVSFCKRDRASMRIIRSIAGENSRHGNHVAFLQRVPVPAMLHQGVGTAELELPGYGLSACLRNIDKEMSVRIQPLDLGDSS